MSEKKTRDSGAGQATPSAPPPRPAARPERAGQPAGRPTRPPGVEEKERPDWAAPDDGDGLAAAQPRPSADGPAGGPRSAGTAPPATAAGDERPTGPTAGATPAAPSGGGPSGDGGDAAPAEAEPTGRQRLRAALWPPRITRGQVIVALLLCVLGLGLAIQVRSTSEHDVLRGARREDLVRILSELDDRTERLEEEKRSLERQREELENSSDQAREARRQTERRERQLGVLAGTVAAEGPGITLTISDPAGAVKADMLLDAIQELRAAGAEAIQVNRVRVVASTHLTDVAGGVRIDGHRVSQPYRFRAIGDPEDLEPALNIPGGVVQTLQRERATVSVARAEEVIVDALRPAKRPDYARSSSQ